MHDMEDEKWKMRMDNNIAGLASFVMGQPNTNYNHKHKFKTYIQTIKWRIQTNLPDDILAYDSFWLTFENTEMHWHTRF